METMCPQQVFTKAHQLHFMTFNIFLSFLTEGQSEMFIFETSLRFNVCPSLKLNYRHIDFVLLKTIKSKNSKEIKVFMSTLALTQY